jgi:hypothetical protein
MYTADFAQVQAESEVEVGTNQESSQSTASYENTYLLVPVEKVSSLQTATAVDNIKKKQRTKVSQKANELTLSSYRFALEEARKR